MSVERFKANFVLNTVRERLFLNFSDEQAKAGFREQFHLEGKDWQELETCIDRQSEAWKRGFTEMGVWKLQTSCTEKAINGFITEHFPGATSKEQEFIGEQILKEAMAPSLRFAHPLDDILAQGLTGVRRYMRNRKLRRSLGHAWAVTKGLIGIAVTIAIFDKTQAEFETIVASLLLLIYTGVMWFTWNHSLAAADFNFAGLLRYLHLKKLMGYWPNDEEYEGQWKIQEQLGIGKIRLIITSFGYTMINLIVCWHLIKLLM